MLPLAPAGWRNRKTAGDIERAKHCAIIWEKLPADGSIWKLIRKKSVDSQIMAAELDEGWINALFLSPDFPFALPTNECRRL